MKRRTLVVFNRIIIFICIAFLVLLIALISSCKPGSEPGVAYSFVCGDSVCSAEEVGVCDIDCDLNIEKEPVVKTPSDVLEELRSRIRNYTREEKLEQENPVVEEDERILVESFTSYLPEKGFRVASRYNLLSIGENISDVISELNKFHLPQVLRSGRLSSNTEAFGLRAAMYEQFLKLRSGSVVFGFDENTERTTTYLSFKEGQPMLDYRLELYNGIFKFFEGETINLLGHEYVITEVTNNTMRLRGLTTPDELLFRDNHGVWVNNRVIPNDVLNVTLKHDYLRIILVAPDDISVLPGKSLREYLIPPEALLTNRLDLVYEGLTETPVFSIKISRRGDKYKLSFTTNKNRSYNIPLAYLNPIKLGDEDNNLVYREGEDNTDYVIKKKDYFIINNNKEVNGLTNILRLISVKEDDNIIVLEDPALEKFVVYFEGTPGVNASADLIIDNVLHKVYVGENDTISVDLDGNGRINVDEVPIITAGNGIIRINSVNNDEINISLITPKEMRENENSDLETDIIINKDGLRIDRDDVKLIRDIKTNSLIGMSNYGTLFVLKDYSDAEKQIGEDLLVEYPVVQRFADVIVKGYE